MIFQDALRSLKEDFQRTFFYFLTFFITTMFMFLFFNMAISEMAVTQDYIFSGYEANVYAYMEHGDIANIMMVFVVIMSCIDIIFANRFFIRNKAEELAVRLVCGATFTQLAAYLLFQTFLILLFAIPLGILCGIGFIPIMNHILEHYLASTFTITVSSSAIVQFTSVILLVVFWTTTLNLSYAYQNEAAKILNSQGEENDKQGSAIFKLLAYLPGFIKVFIGLLCYIYPLYAFYTNEGGMAMYAILGLIGLELLVRYAMLPFITKQIKYRRMHKPATAAYLGFLRADFIAIRVPIYLFIASPILLISFFVTRMENPIAMLMVIVTYIFMSILQALTIMFRLQTVASTRNSEFAVLSQIGFEKTQELKVIRKEMISFFASILFATLLYLTNIFISLILKNVLSTQFAWFMLIMIIVPLLISAVLCYLYYRVVAFHRVTEGQS